MIVELSIEEAKGRRLESRARFALWIILGLTWVVAVAYMWDALTTVPHADRLEASKVVGIPTPRTFFAAAIFSAMELALVLALLWPWRPNYYASRLAVAALGLVTWLISTSPMGLSRIDWVHRRWLAVMVILVGLALIVVLGYRLVQRVPWMPPSS